jgi:hypothetical protein
MHAELLKVESGADTAPSNHTDVHHHCVLETVRLGKVKFQAIMTN